MAGTKRAADSGPSTRASKVAKTDDGAVAKKSARGAKKGGAKKVLPASTFKHKALPLHVNLTHTPPSIDDADAAPLDPGYLGGLTLIATSFTTGSYGWKGNKRLTIELENAEGAEKEKVSVQLTINATVVGSKGAKEDGDAEEKAAEADEPAEEAADED